MPFWDEIVAEALGDYADVKLTRVLIDALAAGLIMNPGRHNVIVASNLFGEILPDLSAAMVRSIGVAPSANLNSERLYPPCLNRYTVPRQT